MADLGNSRLKWGRVCAKGNLESSVALPLDELSEWERVWEFWNPGNRRRSSWSVSSVNPPVASRLGDFLKGREISDVAWYQSAKQVPVRHAIERIETTGADRALAVLAAGRHREPATMNFVVLCGTAITIERIASDGTWEGGAIALGLGMSARALHQLTAQLPCIEPAHEPPAWGASTRPALEAGIYWGVVGAIREILTRQGDPSSLGRVVWTGGDAPWLAASVAWPRSEVVPNLVLQGLAELSFGSTPS